MPPDTASVTSDNNEALKPLYQLELVPNKSYGDATLVDSKQCTKCSKNKPIADFYKKGARFDSRCKECIKTTKKKVRKKNRKYFDSVSSFTVNFIGQPDSRLLADKLKPFIYELKNNNGRINH